LDSDRALQRGPTNGEFNFIDQRFRLPRPLVRRGKSSWIPCHRAAVLAVVLVLAPLAGIFGYFGVHGDWVFESGFLSPTSLRTGEVGGGMANAIGRDGLHPVLASIAGVPIGIGGRYLPC